EGLAPGFIGVGDQRKRQRLLCGEIGMRFRAVARHADHLRAAALELRKEIAEILRLARAAAGVVLGIEVQHRPLASQIGQLQRAAVGGGAREFGSLAADFHRQNFTGSMIASRFKPSHSSRKSSRNPAIWVSAGMPMVICAWNMSAPVCIARYRIEDNCSMLMPRRVKKSINSTSTAGLSDATTSTR